MGMAPSALANESVSLTLLGENARNCSIDGGVAGPVAALSRTVTLGALDSAVNGQTGLSTFTAAVNCNATFYVQASSLNGGLAPANPAPAGFLAVVPYTLAFAMPTQGQPLAFTCSSEALQSQSAGAPALPVNTTGVGCTVGSTRVLSDSPAFNETANFSLSWAKPCTDAAANCQRMAAGTYTDTITILIGHRL